MKTFLLCVFYQNYLIKVSHKNRNICMSQQYILSNQKLIKKHFLCNMFSITFILKNKISKIGKPKKESSVNKIFTTFLSELLSPPGRRGQRVNNWTKERGQTTKNQTKVEKATKSKKQRMREMV